MSNTDNLPPVTITVPVKAGQIANAIIGAIEGGYSPWLHSLDHLTGEFRELPWYSDAALFGRDDFTAEVRYDYPNKPEGNGKGLKIINKEAINAGLTAMAAKCPKHFADLIAEGDDAITHDVFMQCVILGDVVYG